MALHRLLGGWGDCLLVVEGAADHPPSTFYLPPSTFHLLPSTFYLPPSTFYLLPSTFSPLPSAFPFLPSTFYLPPSTVHLLHSITFTNQEWTQFRFMEADHLQEIASIEDEWVGILTSFHLWKVTAFPPNLLLFVYSYYYCMGTTVTSTE